MRLGKKTKTKAAHHVLMKLAIAALNARLDGTLRGPVISLSAQGEPRSLVSFVARERELAEFRAGLAGVTADHGQAKLVLAHVKNAASTSCGDEGCPTTFGG